MSADENAALVRRFFEEVMNGGDPEAAEALVDPGFRAHHPHLPAPEGPLGVLGTLAMLRDGLPDLRYEVRDLLAGEEAVAVRWVATGTHTGIFMGLPPTGHEVETSGIDLFHIAGGRLQEGWVASDMLGLLHRLGAIPGLG